MKTLLLLVITAAACFTASAQTSLPSTKIRTLTGKEISLDLLAGNSDTATVISMWATWCIPCIAELDAINDKVDDWRKEVPFRFLAVSVDDARTSPKVRAFVKGKGWDFEFYLDPNNELKRALNVSDIPYVMILKKGKIIYQHTGYTAGNEYDLIKKIKEL